MLRKHSSPETLRMTYLGLSEAANTSTPPTVEVMLIGEIAV